MLELFEMYKEHSDVKGVAVTQMCPLSISDLVLHFTDSSHPLSISEETCFLHIAETWLV